MSSPCMLFLDAYDSFSNNIVSLLKSAIPEAKITVIRVDDARFLEKSDDMFHAFLKRFDAVIAGPGPGDPNKAQNVGLIAKLWTLPDDIVLPVLGICLGLQSLVIAFGGEVIRLTQPRHGFITEITHKRESLFNGLGTVNATQYHSLHATIGHVDQTHELWQTPSQCPDLEPLAWDLSDSDNGPILMAVKHTQKPFWGAQYHPESICTNDEGSRIIINWWDEVQVWRRVQRERIFRERAGRKGSLARLSSPDAVLDSGYGTENSGPGSPVFDHKSLDDVSSPICEEPGAPHSHKKVFWSRHDIAEGTLDVPELMTIIRAQNGHEPILLESGTKDGVPVRAETGRVSIIGCTGPDSTAFRYWTKDGILETSVSGQRTKQHANINDTFVQLSQFMEANKCTEGPAHVPFWGGLVGYVSYEAGLETLDIRPSSKTAQHPDLWFTFVERSIVIDHVDKQIYYQTLREHDALWISAMEDCVHEFTKQPQPLPSNGETPLDPLEKVSRPSQDAYCDKVRACQYHIRAGDSYELCLTDQTVLRAPDSKFGLAWSPWTAYKFLRASNPAPFAAYLPLDFPSSDSGDNSTLHILSSSPERFLSWTRTQECQFRPIKGTVKKEPHVTLESATKILKSRKEQAENLMIVDLIRHDLHGVAGPGNVSVPQLMQIEEYETVYQLVSVVEGQLPPNKKGIDVLAASLPPGSMTGAPKKRSCELLKEIEENKPRGIYGGVLGYLDVGGGGDFSVVIRTMVGWKGEWRIGAGGAVTALSTPIGEWEEMMAKSLAGRFS